MSEGDMDEGPTIPDLETPESRSGEDIEETPADPATNLPEDQSPSDEFKVDPIVKTTFL